MVCLVPELCVLTGLTDEMRKDFRVMKELATHTRLAPTERHQSLKEFIDNIRNTPNAIKLITDWGLELDQDITDVNAKKKLKLNNFKYNIVIFFKATRSCHGQRSNNVR